MIMSRMYNYVRSREIEGSFNADPLIGSWPITSLRVSHGWGVPTEEDWPYDGASENWPPNRRPEMDAVAKNLRICCYQRVRTLSECKTALATNSVVMAAFKIVPSDWNPSSDGRIAMPSTDPSSSHTVCIIGYDDCAELIQVRNSWGAAWGDQGHCYLPYKYFDQYLIEAWIAEAAMRAPENGSGLKIECSGVVDIFAETPLHGIEIFDATADECVAWTFAVEREGYLDVEEFFVRPQYRQTGRGRGLAIDLISLASRLNKKLRLWIPHSDANNVASPQCLAIFGRMHLKVAKADRKWAAFVAL